MRDQDVFTASNEWRVKITPFGSAKIGHPEDRATTLYTSDVYALREFFQHERDKELGRVRWPEDPNIVVYDEDSVGIVRVVNEAVGSAQKYREDQSIHRFRSRLAKAARWWFDNHPQKCGALE